MLNFNLSLLNTKLHLQETWFVLKLLDHPCNVDDSFTLKSHIVVFSFSFKF